MPKPTYLDSNGNPTSTPTYLDDSGNPIGQPSKGPDLDTLRANINSRPGGAGYTAKDAFKQIGLPNTGFFSGVRQGAADIGSMFTDVPVAAARGMYEGGPIGAIKRLVVDPMNAEAAKSRQAQAQGQPYVGHAIASGIPVIGPFAAQIGEQMGQGDVSGAVARGGINALAAGLSASPEVIGGFGRMPMSREAAVEKLTGSLNPVPQAKPALRGQFADQLDSILRSGTPKNQGQLVNAIQTAMNADKYRSTFIEPYANERVTPPTNYQGAKVPSSFAQGETTIGQLDSRLAQINDTLYPKYNTKGAGSNAAQAQIGSEQAASLTSEANAIRNTLADELSKRTGIPRDTVYAMRKNWGELNNLRETAQLATDTSSMPSQAGVPLSRTGVLQRAIDRMVFKPAANRAIGSVSNRYTPAAEQPVTVNDTPFKTQQAAANERLFARQKMSQMLRNNQ